MENSLPLEVVVTYPADIHSSPTTTSTETSPSPSAPRADSDNSLGPVLALPIGSNRDGSSPSGRENAIGSSGSIGAQAHTSSAATSRDEDGVGGLSPQHEHSDGGVQLNTRVNSSSESANNNSNDQRVSMPAAGVEGLPANRGKGTGLFEDMLTGEMQFARVHNSTTESPQREGLHLQLPSSTVPVARGAQTQDTALYSGNSTSERHSSQLQSIDKPSTNSVYTTGGEKSSTETTEGFALSLSPSSAVAMVGCYVTGGSIDGAHRLQDREFYNSSNATVATIPTFSYYNMVRGDTTSAVIGLPMSTHTHPSPFVSAGGRHSAQTSTNTLAQPSTPSSNSYPSAKAPCAGGSSVAVSHGARSSGAISQQSQHNNSSESNATHTTNNSNNIVTSKRNSKDAHSSSIAELQGQNSSLNKASLRALANDAPFRFLQVEDQKEHKTVLISQHPPMPSLFGEKIPENMETKGNSSHKMNDPSNTNATRPKVGTPHSSRPWEGHHISCLPDFRLRKEKNEKELSAASHSHEPLLSCEDAFAASGASRHPIVCAPGVDREGANGSFVTTGAGTAHYDCDSYRFSEAVNRNHNSSAETLSFAGKTKAKLLTASLDSFLRSSAVVQDSHSQVDAHPLRVAPARLHVAVQNANTFNEGELCAPQAQAGGVVPQLIEVHQRRSLSANSPTESSTGPLLFRSPGSRGQEPSCTRTRTPTDADGDMQVSSRSQSGHLVRRQAESQAGDREEARGVLGGGRSNESSLSLVDQPARRARDEYSRDYQGIRSERASAVVGNINIYNNSNNNDTNGPSYTYAKHSAYHTSSGTPPYPAITHTNTLSRTPTQPRGYPSTSNVDQQTTSPQHSQLGVPNANAPSAYYPHATRRALLQQQQHLPPLTGSQPPAQSAATVSSGPEGALYNNSNHNNNHNNSNNAIGSGGLYRNTSFQQSSAGSFNNSHTSLSADDVVSNLAVNNFPTHSQPAGPQHNTQINFNGSNANASAGIPDLSCGNHVGEHDLVGHTVSASFMPSARGTGVGVSFRRPSGGAGQVTSSANNLSTLGTGVGGGSLNSGNGPWLVASAPNSPQSHLGSGGWSTATRGSVSLTHNYQMSNITTIVNMNSNTNLNIPTSGPGGSSTGNNTSSNMSIPPVLNAPHYYGAMSFPPSSHHLHYQSHGHAHAYRLFIPPPPPHPTTYSTFISYGTESAEANMIAAGMMRRWFAKTCAFMDIARQQHNTQSSQAALTTQGSGRVSNQSPSAAQQTANELKGPSAALDVPRIGDGCSTTDTLVKGMCSTTYSHSSPASSAIASPTNEPTNSGGNQNVGVASSTSSSFCSKPGAGPTSLSMTQQFPYSVGQDGHSQISRASGQPLALTTFPNPSPSLGSSNSFPASPIAPCVIVGLSGINVATNPPDPSRYAEFALWCSDACTWWDKAFTDRTSFSLIGPNAMGPLPMGPVSSINTPIPVPVVGGDRPMSVSVGFRSGLAPPPPHSTSVIGGGLGGSAASSSNRLLGSTSTHSHSYSQNRAAGSDREGPTHYSGISPGARVINADTGVDRSSLRVPPRPLDCFLELAEDRDRERVGRGNGGAGVGPSGGICSSGIAPDAQGGLNSSYVYPHQYQCLQQQQQQEDVYVARTQMLHSRGRNFPPHEHVHFVEQKPTTLVSIPSPVWRGPPTRLSQAPLTLGSANDSAVPINSSLDAAAAGADAEEKPKKKTRRGKRSVEAIQRKLDYLAAARAAHAAAAALLNKHTETNNSNTVSDKSGHASPGSD